MDTVPTIIGAICSAVVILAWFVLPASKAIVQEPSESVLSPEPDAPMTAGETA